MSVDTAEGPDEAETVKVLFRSREGEHPEKLLFLTEREGLGISISGSVLIMSIDRWHHLACKGFGPEYPPAPKGAVGMDWKLQGAECPNCKGAGRVGIMACRQCGATGRLAASVTNGDRQ